MRYGEVLHHERILDLRAGTLHRVVEWRSPAGRRVRVRTTRLVSFTQRSILAVHYEVEALDEPCTWWCSPSWWPTSRLPPRRADPRASSVGRELLAAGRAVRARPARAARAPRRRQPAARGRGDGPPARSGLATATTSTSHPTRRGSTVGRQLSPGQRLALTKFVAYGWSGNRTPRGPARPGGRGAGRRPPSAAGSSCWPTSARCSTSSGPGPTSRSTGSRRSSRPCGSACSTPSRPRPGPSSARSRPRGSPAPATTGTPSGTPRSSCCRCWSRPRREPRPMRCAGGYSTLELARERARTLNLAGAAFPWRTINGEECAGYWPAGSAAVHINADIAAGRGALRRLDRRHRLRARLRAADAGPDGAVLGGRWAITAPTDSSTSTG